MKFKQAAAGLAMLATAAQPALAADDMRDVGTERRSAAFAGAALKLPLSGAIKARPTARLQLGMRHIYQDVGNGSATRYRQIGLLELGGTKQGKPQLLIGGQSTAAMEKRLGLLGGTGTLLILSGVALGVLAAVTLLDDDNSNAQPAN